MNIIWDPHPPEEAVANAMVYPSPQLVGDKFVFNAEEKELIISNLEKYWGEIDEPLKPFLLQINKNPHIVTVFSCWGHQKGQQGHELAQPGNLFFRADVGPDVIVEKILIPMIQRFAPTGMIGSATPWVWLDSKGLPKISYLIGDINPFSSNRSREEVLKFFINLADTL